jgi:heme exporter protein C
VGYLALVNAIEDKKRADKAGALLVIVGSINVPIIYFSVKWWNTLHQGYSISNTGSKMAPMMVWAMLIMVFACWAYAIAVVLARVRAIILERERDAAWVQQLEPEGVKA